MGMSASEVFPNAPLALVAVEVRFSNGSASSVATPVQRAIRDRLGGEWVIEGTKVQTFEVPLLPVGAAPSVRSEHVSRITSRDRTQIVTLRSNGLTIEATRYEGYDRFRRLLHEALSATEEIFQPEGISRLGLRYIDEISVPGVTGSAHWGGWIHESLLPPTAEGLRAATWTGVVQYDFDPERHLVLRYGPSDQPVVAATGPLRRLRSFEGPIFTMDFDSFWQPSDIPVFSADRIALACDELLVPVRTLFHTLVTDRLREEVFRQEVAK